MASVRYKQNPTDAEWLEIKPRFIQLYHTDGKYLKIVRKILEDECGFVASVSGFKEKIRAWDLRKSYSAAERDQLLPYLDDKSGSTQPDPDIKIRGKDVDWKRIQRHKVSRQRQGIQHGALIHHGPVPGNSNIVPHPLHDPREQCLQTINRFWCFEAVRPLSETADAMSDGSALDAELTDAAIFLSLRNGEAQADSHMRRFCQLLPLVAAQQPSAVMRAMTGLAVNLRWKPHPRTRAKIFEFVKRRVVADGQTSSDLRQVLSILDTMQTLDQMAVQMLHVQINSLLPHASNDFERMGAFLTDALTCLTHCGLSNDALKYATIIAEFTSLDMSRRREMNVLISRFYYETGQYDSAIVAGRQALSQCDIDRVPDISTAYTIVNTCEILAKCHEASGDLEAAIETRRLAFMTAQRYFGDSASNTVYHLEHLDKAIARQTVLEQGRVSLHELD